jgi:hypothetical protein
MRALHGDAGALRAMPVPRGDVVALGSTSPTAAA